MSQDVASAGWAYVARLVAAIVSLFGDARFFGSLLAVRPALRRQVFVWLRPAEAIARRLLLAHALALPAPNAVGLASSSIGRASSGHGRGGFAHDDPARWPVRFQMTPRAARKRAATRRPARPPRLISGLGIAERLEALIRVAADPERYARRLAARLARTNSPRLHLPRERLAFTPELLAAIERVVQDAERRESG